MEVNKFSTPIWYRVTLWAGEDLFHALREFFKQERLKEAYILSCIGSLEEVVLAYPKTKQIPPEVERITLEGLFEINGISGNIKQEAGEIKVHLHGSVSKAGREVSGGAINEGTRIFKVAELVIIGTKGG
ncbi:MAG: DNA-binding protein [Deltaproteobacteria bacterium]|nr:DNA-binding protein [Deltaproteobacteria bacterium]